MAQFNDFSRSLTAFDPGTTPVVVVEMSEASWLVLGAVPGVERQPLKKIAPDASVLQALIERWRSEAVRAGRPVSRIVLAYEAGRDGFWLARWLGSRGIEVHVIHSASVAVSRERKRAKTDRLDAAMLMRVLLGWLRRAGSARLRHDASVAIAGWWRSRPLRKRMHGVRAVSAKASSARNRGSPTA